MLFRSWSRSDFSQGLAAVYREDKGWGYINRSGKVVIPFKFSGATPFKDGLAVISVDGKYGYISQQGKIVIPLRKENELISLYSSSGFYEFSDGLALISNRDQLGYINHAGKVVIKPKYIRASPFSENIASVIEQPFSGDKSECLYIDKTGKSIIVDRFNECGSFHDGVALVEINGKMGYVSTAGQYIYKPNEASKIPPIR